MDTEHESETLDIVIRDKDGDFEIGDPPMQSLEEQEEGGPEDAREDESVFAPAVVISGASDRLTRWQKRGRDWRMR